MLPSGKKENIIRYKYIHIWASKNELRAKSTDPNVLKQVISAIKKSHQNADFERHHDVSNRFQGFRLKGLDTDEEDDEKDDLEKKNIYFGLAWWMFQVLCERGWEPMQTGDYWYKLKFKETFNHLDL